ncbi:hypothetical protein EOPP23_12530 [Endozoicomonas sp. OPT23]|uniref:hypothetical protein n=1 Tax=Endozoicomonas sp. OPT23 TaxID=2072845 RepID=UPI00129B8AD1|nr:hypothetical protein [Endozoicomonas sp. OPT23]MRI33812.1 hypothetical protein [Endozoicomonas sp. OPT23]
MIMPDYETIDAIADAYNPLLALLVLILLAMAVKQGQRELTKKQAVSLCLAMATVYGLYFLDAGFSLWPSAGLDYSSHTAFALVLVLHLMVYFRKFTGLLVGTFLIDLLLMKYQEYHTWEDMLTTAAVVTALYLPMLFYCRLGKSIK